MLKCNTNYNISNINPLQINKNPYTKNKKTLSIF